MVNLSRIVLRVLGWAASKPDHEGRPSHSGAHSLPDSCYYPEPSYFQRQYTVRFRQHTEHVASCCAKEFQNGSSLYSTFLDSPAPSSGISSQVQVYRTLDRVQEVFASPSRTLLLDSLSNTLTYSLWPIAHTVSPRWHQGKHSSISRIRSSYALQASSMENGSPPNRPLQHLISSIRQISKSYALSQK